MTRIVDDAAREITALHAHFVALFTGRSRDISRCNAAFAEDFEMVSPNGLSLGREAILAGLQGAQASPDFSIAISAIRPIWSSGNSVLLQYVEQQYRDGKTSRRLSTAFFEARTEAPNGVVWRYLHETWMRDADE